MAKEVMFCLTFNVKMGNIGELVEREINFKITKKRELENA
jgi:hypothetical protein